MNLLASLVLLAALLGDAPSALPQHFTWRSADIATGGRPDGDAAFAALHDYGFQVIVNVDGAAPDVEAAKCHGLRYVHLPMTYGVIAPDVLAGMRRLLDEKPGKIFIHCHHGVHRAPAFAATALRMLGKETPEQARVLLEQAGTSKDYPGLWYSAIEAPLAEVKASDAPLQERCTVSTIVAAMVRADDAYDLLKQANALHWKPLPAHPDFVPRDAALTTVQALKEVEAMPAAKEADFAAKLKACITQGEALVAVLAKPDNTAYGAAFEALHQSCEACHKVYRNPPLK